MSNDFDIDELEAPEGNWKPNDQNDNPEPELETPGAVGPTDPEEPISAKPAPELEPRPAVSEPAGEVAETAQKTKRMLDAQKKVKIRVPSTEIEKDPITVGVNGYVYQIKRDEWVEVPDSVYRVLDDAKFTIYTQKKREDGEGNEFIQSEAQRIAFQVAGDR